MDNATIELEKFLTWFSDLEEIPIYTRRDFLAHVMEVGGIDEKAAKFIDDTLGHLDDNQERQMIDLDRLNATLNFLSVKTSEMEAEDIAQAEAEMQKIADKFTKDFRETEMAKVKHEETQYKKADMLVAEAIRVDV